MHYGPRPKAETQDLTRREEDFLRCMCEGKTNKQIAFELELTEGTIKVYSSRLYRKLNVQKHGNSRVTLALAAMQERIDELEFIRLALMQRVRELEQRT